MRRGPELNVQNPVLLPPSSAVYSIVSAYGYIDFTACQTCVCAVTCVRIRRCAILSGVVWSILSFNILDIPVNIYMYRNDLKCSRAFKRHSCRSSIVCSTMADCAICSALSKRRNEAQNLASDVSSFLSAPRVCQKIRQGPAAGIRNPRHVTGLIDAKATRTQKAARTREYRPNFTGAAFSARRIKKSKGTFFGRLYGT